MSLKGGERLGGGTGPDLNRNNIRQKEFLVKNQSTNKGPRRVITLLNARRWMRTFAQGGVDWQMSTTTGFLTYAGLDQGRWRESPLGFHGGVGGSIRGEVIAQRVRIGDGGLQLGGIDHKTPAQGLHESRAWGRESVKREGEKAADVKRGVLSRVVPT